MVRYIGTAILEVGPSRANNDACYAVYIAFLL